MSQRPPLLRPARSTLAGRCVALRSRPKPSRDVKSCLNRRQSFAAFTAWAWSCDVISHFGQPDRYAYEAIYRLENAGSAKEIVFELRDDLNLDRVLVEGIETPIATSGKLLQVSLPANVRFPTVVLHYASPRLTFPLREPRADRDAHRQVSGASTALDRLDASRNDRAIQSVSFRRSLAGADGLASSPFRTLMASEAPTRPPLGRMHFHPFGFSDQPRTSNCGPWKYLVNFGRAAATALSTAKADERSCSVATDSPATSANGRSRPRSNSSPCGQRRALAAVAH